MRVGDRPANDLAALRLNIARSYASLGENQRRIARFILDHPEEIAFMTVVGMAKRAETSPASLIRFAHALGYSGFREIQRVFENALISGTEAQPQILDHAARDLAAQDKAICDILRDVSTATIAAIRRLQGEPLLTGLDRATEFLRRALQVYVLAEGRAFSVGFHVAQALSHTGKPARLLSGIGGMLREQALALTSNDALIVVTSESEGRSLVEAVQRCVRIGAPVIAIADNLASPLMEYADVILEMDQMIATDCKSSPIAFWLAEALVGYLGFDAA